MHSVAFDCGSASSLAVEQAAYKLAPMLTVVVEPRASDQAPFDCQLVIKPECKLEGDEVVAEFRRHVNDYYLREKIEAKTEGVRILLYAQAFSKVSINP